MRTIQNLLKTKGNINVYLGSKAVCDLFLQNAEQEGFVFRDGRKPTESPYNDLIAVHHDFTIGHHGFVGHEAFRLKGKMKPIVPTVWIDYAKYLAGDRKYVIRGTDHAIHAVRGADNEPFRNCNSCAARVHFYPGFGTKRFSMRS